MGIIVAAMITTALVLVVYGFVLRCLAPDVDDRNVAWRAAQVMLVMQPLVFYAVRMPLHHFLESKLGAGPALTAISLFYAPLTEEPAKWLVLLLPFIRHKLTPQNAVAIAIGAGLGFAIGEIWMLAYKVMGSAAVRELPFYAFSGFMIERFLVTFVHGAMVVFLFKWFAQDGSFWPGALLGVALHFALNFPVYLMSIDLGGLGRPIWSLVIQVYQLAFIVGLIVAVRWLTKRNQPAAGASTGGNG
jgi:RsiW-degrading membrane proteinase PrsW (M82 family)